MKVCTKCGKECPATIEYFYRRLKSKDGLYCWCQECCRKYARDKSKTIKGKLVREKTNVKYFLSKKYKLTRKIYELSEKGKLRRIKFIESEKGKISLKKSQKKYRQSEKGKLWWKKYRQTERAKLTKEDAQKKYRQKNKLSLSMKSLIYQSLKGNKNGRHWEDFVPYTLLELQLHLQGTIGLTTEYVLNELWEGFYGPFYHIDHIRPRASFKNLKDPNSEDFRECWVLFNLRLLDPIENIRKNDRYDR